MAPRSLSAYGLPFFPHSHADHGRDGADGVWERARDIVVRQVPENRKAVLEEALQIPVTLMWIEEGKATKE